MAKEYIKVDHVLWQKQQEYYAKLDRSLKRFVVISMVMFGVAVGAGAWAVAQSKRLAEAEHEAARYRALYQADAQATLRDIKNSPDDKMGQIELGGSMVPSAGAQLFADGSGSWRATK
jgi:hypothetical protein